MRLRINDLAPGVYYILKLKALTATGASEWSRPFTILTTSDNVAPNTPTNVVGTMAGTAFNLTWDQVVSSADGSPAHDLDAYEILVSSSGTATTKSYVSKDRNFQFTLEMNRQVFGSPRANIIMAVRAVDITGNPSAYSNGVSQTNPAPANPTGVTATAVPDGIVLKWNAVTDADLAGYKVYSGTTAGTQTTLVWMGSATSATIPSTAYSTDTWYRVVAYDVFTTESTGTVAGPVRPNSPFTVDSTAPAIPTGLAATLTNATDGKTAKAVVTWTAVTDTDGDLSEYIIDYKPSSETNWDTTKVDYEKTAVTLVGLIPYVNYDFRIRSSDWSANLSNWSAVVTKTATANTAPATVSNVYMGMGIDGMTVSWVQNTEPDVANGAGTYMVEVATNDTFTTGLLSYRTGGSALTISGLAQGTRYYARVKAVDSLGLASAAWSTTASATTGTTSNFKQTISATEPPTKSVGDIWNDTTSGFEKQWNGTTWVLTGNASVSYISAKGTDLVTNGTGLMRNNYNFTAFDFDGADAPTGASGSFISKTGAAAALTIDELIAFDPNKSYRFSFSSRQTVAGGTGKMYGFLVPYNAAGSLISPQNYMFHANTTTTLAAPLNNGDTTVTLTSAANWYGSATKPANANAHNRSMILWNYTDSAGKVWPAHTYSMYPWVSDAWADGGVNGNVITLRAPWSGGNFAAGHPVSNGSAGGSFLYMPNASNVEAPETWTYYADTFSSGAMGVATAESGRAGASFNTGMPPGTAKIKVGWLVNYAPSTGRHAIAGVSLSDASAAQATADAAVKTYVTEYSVNASETVAPTTGWSTATPTRTPGNFIWTRVTVTRGDGTTSTTSPALLTGNTGAAGTPAATISLTATAQVLTSPAGGGATNPTTSTVTGTAVNTTITAWTYSVDGAAFSATVPAGVSRTGNVVTITGSTMTARTITVKMADANGVSDTLTVAKVMDGAAGATGGTGGTGPAGADAYTVILTNEAQVFPGSTNAALAGSATTSVIAYKGATQTTATIGTITGQVAGLTTAITNNGTNNATVTVTVTTALTTQSGTLTIPVTVDGKSFTKTFAWSVSYIGAQGSQGIPGTPGADGTSLYTWLKYADTPTTGMSDSPAGKAYMGIAYNKTTATESTNYADYDWSLVKGADGSAGADGKGISSTAVTYQVHTNGTTAPTGTWVASPPATTTGQFLWTRTITTYTDASTVTAYSVSAHGATGTAGAAGRGISGTVVTYQVHTNGTTAPTGTWLSSVPATSPGQFLWTRTVTSYTDATPAVTAYSVAAHGNTGQQGIPGNPGADGVTTYTWVKYATSAAGAGLNDDPTGMTHIGLAFNKTTATESTTPGDYQWSLIQGPAGANGVSVTSITPYYAQVATGAAAPAIPVVSPPVAPWTATEPAYVANTELYRTDRVLFSNSTFQYTAVVKVSAYTAAATAMATATGKNKIIKSTGDATGTVGFVDGDTWHKYDGSNNIIAQWKFTGGAWVSEKITDAMFTTISAGKMAAGSAFIVDLDIGAGGSIKSAGYTDAGTSGFKLSTTGLVIKGTNNSVDVAAVTAGTISAKTWNVGTGGVINVDSTGVIKSNNWASLSTGYRLSNAGLEINDGSVDAKVLKTNSAVIGDLIIGRSADALGTIRSFDYSAGTAGWKIGKGLFEINNGLIKAAALQLQTSPNLMPPQFADFEYQNDFYISSFWKPTGQNGMSVSGGAADSSAVSAVNRFKGTRALSLDTIGGTATLTAWFGTSSTDYNISLEPGKTYIWSAYVKNRQASAQTWTFSVKGDNGATIGTQAFALGASEAAMVRRSFAFTVPAGVNAGIVSAVSTAGAASAIYVDGMQLEEKTGADNTPSVWSPPGSTTMNGAGITTGMIRSSESITIAGVDQPVWSLNTAGNMQIGDALIRGKMIVGTTTETLPNRAPNGGNFETNVTGYQVYHVGATGTAIARTTTGGEVITGTGSAKVTAAAGSKSVLGISFNTAQTYLPGTTVTVSANVKTNAATAGSVLGVSMWNSSLASVATGGTINDPVANNIYPINFSYTVQEGEDVATIILYQSGTGLTTTSFIVDDIVITADNEIGTSYIQSANYSKGNTGWKIDGNGNPEFNNGIFRGTLGAGMVTAETLSSVINISNVFRAGDETGKRVIFSPDGIQSYRADNSMVLNIPTDDSVPASIDGDFLASSLTVSDQMAIRGTNNELSRGATLTVQSGTTAPSSPPTVSIGWDSVPIGDGTVDGFSAARQGATFQGGWVRVPITIYASGVYIESFDVNTGARAWGSIDVAHTDGMWVVQGITSIVDKVFLLGQRKDGSWRIMGFNLTTAYSGLGSRFLDVSFPYQSYMRKPSIGHDGTNLVVGYTHTSNNLLYQMTFSATTGAKIGSTVTSNLTKADDVASINKGVFDNAWGTAGAPVFVVTFRNDTNAYVFDASMQRLSGLDFPLPAKPSGQFWANNAFYTSASMSGRTYKHTGIQWNSFVTGASTWHIGTTWYDGNTTGSTHETTVGPLKTFTMKKRARLTVTTPPYPIRPVPNTADDATASGIYLSRQASVPARTNLERLTYTADGVRTFVLDSSTPLPGVGATASQPPPLNSNFPASTPGTIRTDNDRFFVRGDGSGGWAGILVDTLGAINVPITTTTNIKMHKQDYVGGTTDASGFLTFTHSAGFTPTSAFVTMRAPGSTFAMAIGADSFSSTSVRVRFSHASSAAIYASASTGAFSVLFFG